MRNYVPVCACSATFVLSEELLPRIVRLYPLSRCSVAHLHLADKARVRCTPVRLSTSLKVDAAEVQVLEDDFHTVFGQVDND